MATVTEPLSETKVVELLNEILNCGVEYAGSDYTTIQVPDVVINDVKNLIDRFRSQVE